MQITDALNNLAEAVCGDAAEDLAENQIDDLI